MRSSRDLYVQLEKLKLIAAEQAQVISEQKEQLRIKSNAIQQQTQDIKKLDTELLWMRAALEQAEKTQNADAQDDVDWQEKYARLQAETDNLRKRLESRASEKVREERNRVLMDMLPLADHLELALRHSESLDEASLIEPVASAEGNQGSSATNFMDNIRVTQSAFLSTLQRYGIEPIKALGEPFDPTLHEAVGQTDLTDVPADHVAQVLQTGYRDGERLLRPARVIVSKD